MLVKMECNSANGGGVQTYYEALSPSISADYTITCGFKPNKIVLAGAYSASRVYPHNLSYDADVDEGKYTFQNSFGNKTYSIGDTSSEGTSEGPIIISMTDTSVTIRNITSNLGGNILITE